MLTLDEILAPVAERPPTKPFVFEALRGRLRIDIIPPSKRNADWFNRAVGESMKPAPADEAALVDFRAGCHAGVDTIAETLIGGWAVQETEGGDHVARPYNPDLGKEFLHRLIDLPQGLAEFLAFRDAVFAAAIAESRTSVDPTETAGNSSGG